MTATLTKEAKETILNGLIGMKESPFIREGNQLFMKFDSMRIQNDYENASTRTDFIWRGKAVCHLHVPGHMMADDKELHITGIEGRQCVSLYD